MIASAEELFPGASDPEMMVSVNLDGDHLLESQRNMGTVAVTGNGGCAKSHTNTEYKNSPDFEHEVGDPSF